MDRVKATEEKIELLKEMQGMIHTLKQFAARIQERIDIMIDADLRSMEAEKAALDKMEQTIKTESNGKQKARATKRAK